MPRSAIVLRASAKEADWGLATSRTRTAAHRRRISNDHATPWDVHVPDASSTTHLCVVDGTGTAVSLTQTLLSWFGSRMLVPGTGVVLNNGMMWFDPVPGRANSIGPGRRPLSNMTPAIVLSRKAVRSSLSARPAAAGFSTACARSF